MIRLVKDYKFSSSQYSFWAWFQEINDNGAHTSDKKEPDQSIQMYHPKL